MQILPLTLEITTKTLVFSHTDATPYVIPILNTEDGLDVRLQLVRRINLYSRPSQLFQRQNVSGGSFRVALGTAANELAAGNITVLSADGYEIQGVVSIATAGIAALADLAETTLEIKGYNGTSYIHAGFPVRIRKSVSVAGALVAPPGDTALGSLEANRIYVRKDGAAGDSIILTSPLGKQIRLACVDDGAGGATIDWSPIA